MVPTELQRVAEIANCLENFIAVGTIFFVNVPTDTWGFQAVNVPLSSYKWVEAEYLQWAFQSESLNPVLRTLLSLIVGKYLVATYKVRTIALLRVWKIRVYAIPLDIDGSRHLRLWRRSRKLTLTAKAFGEMWMQLLSVMDFSNSTWCSSLDTNTMLQGMYLVPFLASNGTNGNNSELRSHHLKRWIKKEPLLPPRVAHEPLEAIVERIYSQVSLPDLSKYRTLLSELPQSEIATGEDLVARLLRDNENNSLNIKGVRTSLYAFQVRSLCKMYEKESMPQRSISSNFIQIESATGGIYYYDVQLPGLYLQAELTLLPRGGILAENMGLGKTLICLSLICVTVHEVSMALEVMLPCLTTHKATNRTTPLLSDICVDAIVHNSLPWKYYQEDLAPSISKKLSESPAKCHLLEDGPVNKSKSGKRNRREIDSRELYLCHTTLIIVPENLFHQWSDEIKKHISEGYLKVLYVSNRFKTPIKVPKGLYTDTLLPLEEIVNHDLVIITNLLFGRGVTSDILRKVYWKRLIVDEGHSMTSKTSVVSVKCSSLLAERRWVVTGTPTSGLTALHMEENSGSIHQMNGNDQHDRHHSFVVKTKYNVKDDLLKLGNLVSLFFKMEPYSTQLKLWNNAIIKGLSSSATYAIEHNVLQLLNSLMVRHNQIEVQNDLKLPKLHHQAVILEPSYQNKLAMNLFTAVLAVNAVSSERVGPDYMFSANNKLQLRQLIRNLQFASFYWTGFQEKDVEALISVANETIRKSCSENGLKLSATDTAILHNSIRAATQAFENPRWRLGSHLHEMQYFVRGVSPGIGRYFSLGLFKEFQIYAAPNIHALQEFYYKNRFVSSNGFQSMCDNLQTASQKFWERNQNNATSKNGSQSTSKDLNDRMRFMDRLKELIPRPSKVPKTLQNEENQSKFHFTELEYRNLNGAEISGTASSKLSYLGCKLMSHMKNAIKSIVFFDNQNNGYYLTELLEVLGVPYILYANFIGSEQRANNLKKFANHSPSRGGLALIMDLSLAAHGLTIIAATHVYFISPVWQRSVEAQAIKRAHRIGQTKEVFVETLILRGTLEEEMYRIRSQQLEDIDRNIDQTSMNMDQSVIEDREIQQFIMKHSFLPVSECEDEFAKFNIPSDVKRRNSSNTNGSHNNSHNDETERRYGLLEHHITQITNDIESWSMQLFSNINLQRFEDLKQEKANSFRLNLELVTSKSNEVSVAVKPKRTHKRVKF